MTELETLRTALQEDAARLYGKRRARWRLAVPIGAAGLAAVAIALVVFDLAGAPNDEAAAGPTPSPTVSFTSTPGTAQTAPPIPPNHENGPLELAEATPVATNSPALKNLLGGSPEIVRAWYVPKLQGHVILSRRSETPYPPGTEPPRQRPLLQGRDWCLSAPDPLADQPDIERGSTCGPSQSIQLGIGSTSIIFVPEGTNPPELTNPDGTRETLQPTQGLVVILSRPEGSRLDSRP